MVETLEFIVPEAEHVMHRIVEKAADTGGTDPVGFGLQIKHLSDHAAFPEKVPVKKRRFFNGCMKFRDHS